jgi:predicted Zn-dependent peptidase
MVKKIVLKNGLRLILAPQAGLAATVLVLVEAGSEYETRNINGLSHFLEHLAFKGTEKRPKPGMIAAELDSLGAEYNAFTAQEYTGYWAKVHSRFLPQILDLISDLYLNPIFDREEINKERGVIIEEINMYEDMPMRRVHDFFTALLYGNQPAGWDIAGRKEVIRRLEREDFIKYRTRHYIAPATVVVVSGDFEPGYVIPRVNELFGSLRRQPKSPKPKTRERQTRPHSLIKFKKSDQTHLVLGTRAFTIFDKRRYALQVLSDILGGGMSSRLFRRIREELGAAYYVRAVSDLFSDHGYFAVSAGVDHAKIKIVIEAILQELGRLREEIVEEGELRKSKEHLIGNLILSLETSDELAAFYGGQEIITRSIIKTEQLIQRIQRVSAEEIRKVARLLFTDTKLNLAVIGPYRNPAIFRKILKF